MCGNTMMVRIKNQKFKEKLGVATLSAKIYITWNAIRFGTWDERETENYN